MCVNLVFGVSHLACSNSLAVRYSEYKQPADTFHRIKLYLPGDQGEILCITPGCVRVPLAAVCTDLPTKEMSIHTLSEGKNVRTVETIFFDRFVIFESLPRVLLVALLALPEQTLSSKYEHYTNFEEAKLTLEQLVDIFKGKMKN